jgi:hypothetical protein
MCSRMLALKDTCMHPQSQKPYIKSYGGGKNNSPEGAAVRIHLHVSMLPSPLEALTHVTFIIGRSSIWFRVRIRV